MSAHKLVGLAGSFNRPSKTFALVENVAGLAAEKYGFDNTIYDLTDVGPSLGQALRRDDLDSRAREVIDDIVNADVLVIGAPTYKGSYPGLFKHLIDLIDPHELRAKPIVITATGGGDRHALMVEHQLRPLFGFSCRTRCRPRFTRPTATSPITASHPIHFPSESGKSSASSRRSFPAGIRR